MRKLENRKGFTLGELLIVVAIIGVLVSISIPMFTSQLEKAREATDAANIRSQYAQVMSDAILDGGDINGKEKYGVIDLKQQKDTWNNTELGSNLESLFGKENIIGEYPKAGGTAWVSYENSVAKLYYAGEGSNTAEKANGNQGITDVGNKGSIGGNAGKTDNHTGNEPGENENNYQSSSPQKDKHESQFLSGTELIDKIKSAAKLWPDSGNFSPKRGEVYMYNNNVYISAEDQNNLDSNGSPETGGWYVWNFIQPGHVVLTRGINVDKQGNVIGGVHRGDLFEEEDGTTYIMKTTANAQNAPLGDKDNWVQIKFD